MNKWLEILVGLIFVLGAIFMAYRLPNWLTAALILLKGTILWAVLLLGIMFIVLGIIALKE